MRKRKASQAVRAGSLVALASSRKPFTSSGRGGGVAMFLRRLLAVCGERRFAGGLQRLLGGLERCGVRAGLHNSARVRSTRRSLSPRDKTTAARAGFNSSPRTRARSCQRAAPLVRGWRAEKRKTYGGPHLLLGEAAGAFRRANTRSLWCATALGASNCAQAGQRPIAHAKIAHAHLAAI